MSSNQVKAGLGVLAAVLAAGAVFFPQYAPILTGISGTLTGATFINARR